VDVQGSKFLYKLLAVSRGRLKLTQIPLDFAPRQEGISNSTMPLCGICWSL